MAYRFIPPSLRSMQRCASRRRLLGVGLALSSGLALLPAPVFQTSGGLAAQSVVPDPLARGWNGPEVLELVGRARSARARLAASEDLESYRARLEGHIYFFVDPDLGARNLIRIDQVAAELSWEAPDRLQQHVVGERSETRLPVRDFDYYPDRLTLVPYGFGDEIRIGSGRDVARVRHPIAFAGSAEPASELYDFRLGDSVSLALAGRDEPVRVQEVVVQPRDPDSPGFVGTIHLDRDSGSIVQMAFTFTPSSYVDDRNDRVLVELDYGLWGDRYWLPNLQQIEVRREIPVLDLGVGTVIRSILRVRDYELNAPLSDAVRSRPEITLLPTDLRSEHEFSVGLYQAMEQDGLLELVVDADVNELRDRAMDLIGQVPPSGLSPARLHLPGASSALRYDRAEGVRLGLGGSLERRAGTSVRGTVGFATAPADVQAAATTEVVLTPAWSLRADVERRALGDLGLAQGSAALLSSLGALIRGEDYLDPYWVSGGGLRLDRRASEDSRIFFGIGVEQHANASREVRDAPLDGSRRFREVRQVAPAEFLRGFVGARRPLALPGGGRGWGRIDANLLHGQPGSGIGLSAELRERWGPSSGNRELELHAAGWSWLGDTELPQGHRLIGGRGTLPGYPFRAFAGRHAAAGSLVGSADVWGPLLRIRTGFHLGWAGGVGAELGSAWNTRATGGVIAAGSAGFGVGWDLLRVDLARGLSGGEWQLILSIDPDWWDRL